MRPATSLIGARSGSAPVASCTVSYAMPGHLLLEQRVGDGGVRGEVQVGEEDEPGPEVPELLGLRLLHLQHEVGAAPHVGGGVDDLGAGGRVLVVGDRRVDARARLDEHGDAVRGAARARRRA